MKLDHFFVISDIGLVVLKKTKNSRAVTLDRPGLKWNLIIS